MSLNSSEVVGVFHDVTSLEDAANTLMSNGFDRSGLTLIATEDVVRKELGSRVVRVEQLEDYSGTPRIAYVNRDDLAIGQAPRHQPEDRRQVEAADLNRRSRDRTEGC